VGKDVVLLIKAQITEKGRENSVQQMGGRNPRKGGKMESNGPGRRGTHLWGDFPKKKKNESGNWTKILQGGQKKTRTAGDRQCPRDDKGMDFKRAARGPRKPSRRG